MTENNKSEGSDIPKVNETQKSSLLEKAKEAYNDITLQQPVTVRLKRRMAELRELTKAKHESVKVGNKRIWHTTTPKLFLGGLDGVVSGGVGTISYFVYKTDKDGNKIRFDHMATITDADGKSRTIAADSEYIKEKEVIERIEYRKPIKREEFKVPHPSEALKK